MPTISECKLSLIELAKKSGFEPHEIWAVLAGGTAKSRELAEFLEGVTGFQAKNLMFEGTKNHRPGVLDWVAAHVDIAKNSVWRHLDGRMKISEEVSSRYAEFAGTNYEWMIRGE